MLESKFVKLLIHSFLVFIWLFLIAFIVYVISSWQFGADRKSLNVFAWAGLYDPAYIQKFEQESGIKINFSYFNTNEELLVKLRATGGKGYDLIFPGDYAVNILIKEGLLKKLDKLKLPFFKDINPNLLGHYFDPNNDFSLPAEWAVYGIGYDKDFFNGRKIENSWKIVLDPEYIPDKIAMVNDPLIAIPLAALYLFGSAENFTVDKIDKIKNLLIAQKPFVIAYTEFRPDYYLSTKNSALAVASSAYIWRSMYYYDHVDFIVPQEGSILTIENFCIPIASEKEDLVYEFLNFLMRDETAIHHFKGEYAIFPVTTKVIDKLSFSKKIYHLLTMTAEDFKKFSFVRLDKLTEPITEQYLQDLWIKIKS